MDPVRMDARVVVRPEAFAVEVFFVKQYGSDMYVAVPQEVERGTITWKDEKVDEAHKAPVSLQLSYELYHALKEAMTEDVSRVTAELSAEKARTEMLGAQLLTEQARVEKLISHALR